MAIKRNRPAETPDRLAAIEEFGAAAEARPTGVPAAPSPKREARRPTSAGEGAKGSLIRWAGNEELRDRVADYSRSQRYPQHEVILRALAIGMAKLEADSNG
jgi:hypothetical protein